jgi:hypothetical protein
MRKFLQVLLISVSLVSISCVTTKKDNGKHKGWYKNPKNPHHPAHQPNSTVKPAKKAVVSPSKAPKKSK